MMKFTILIFSLLTLGISSPIFAQCTINGQAVAENSNPKFNKCLICDSTQNKTGYSPVICDIPNVDSTCQIVKCDTNQGCVSQQLPEHTTCSDSTCSEGKIKEQECTKGGKCSLEITTNCNGYTCANATQCEVACSNNTACQSPATCIAKVCQLPIHEPDMAPDMNSKDMSVSDINDSDVESDMAMDLHKELDTSPMADMKIDLQPEVSKPVVSGGGCASISNTPSTLFFLFIGFFALLSKRKKL